MAYEAAMRQLSYRRRSMSELTTYLMRHDYSLDVTSEVVRRLVAYGLIDDMAFARAWVADRRLLRPKSKRALAAELGAKGIERTIINTVLRESDPNEDIQVLTALIERKRRLTQYSDPQKLMAHFARQGYDYGQIKEALSRLD